MGIDVLTSGNHIWDKGSISSSRRNRGFASGELSAGVPGLRRIQCQTFIPPLTWPGFSWVNLTVPSGGNKVLGEIADGCRW